MGPTLTTGGMGGPFSGYKYTMLCAILLCTVQNDIDLHKIDAPPTHTPYIPPHRSLSSYIISRGESVAQTVSKARGLQKNRRKQQQHLVNCSPMSCFNTKFTPAQSGSYRPDACDKAELLALKEEQTDASVNRSQNRRAALRLDAGGTSVSASSGLYLYLSVSAVLARLCYPSGLLYWNGCCAS